MKSTPINETRVLPIRKGNVWAPYSRNVRYLDPVRNLHKFVMSVHDFAVRNPSMKREIKPTAAAISDINSILNIQARNERRVSLGSRKG